MKLKPIELNEYFVRCSDTDYIDVKDDFFDMPIKILAKSLVDAAVVYCHTILKQSSLESYYSLDCQELVDVCVATSQFPDDDCWTDVSLVFNIMASYTVLSPTAESEQLQKEFEEND